MQNKIIYGAAAFLIILLSSCAVKLPVQRYHVRMYVIQQDSKGRLYPKFIKDEPADILLQKGDTIKKYFKQ